MSGSGISWAICKSAPRSRQITMPAAHRSVFFTGRMPFLPPNQQLQSTEGKKTVQDSRCYMAQACAYLHCHHLNDPWWLRWIWWIQWTLHNSTIQYSTLQIFNYSWKSYMYTINGFIWCHKHSVNMVKHCWNRSGKGSWELCPRSPYRFSVRCPCLLVWCFCCLC